MNEQPDLPVPFVRHDAKGQITGRGSMEPKYIEAEAEREGGIIASDGHTDTHYVDLSGPRPMVRVRRKLTVAFDTTTPAPGAPARASLPPGSTITVTGPVAGTAATGGELDLVLQVPGTYQVTVNAWPRRPAVETLTVPVVEGPVPTPPEGAVVIGPGIAAVRDRAKEIATQHYATLALVSRPVGLQAADLLKAAEAERVLVGEESEWISEEAAERGLEPAALAKLITVESAKTIARERERTKLTGAIARAVTESEVILALQSCGLTFSLPEN